MELDQLDFYLDRDNAFGVNIKARSPEFIAWLLLTKRKPVERFFDLFEKDESDEYTNQLLIRESPYQIWVAELKQDVFERDIFPAEEDYAKNESFNFQNLSQVQEFLKSMNIDIKKLRWSSEIQFL